MNKAASGGYEEAYLDLVLRIVIKMALGHNQVEILPLNGIRKQPKCL